MMVGKVRNFFPAVRSRRLQELRIVSGTTETFPQLYIQIGARYPVVLKPKVLKTEEC